MVRGAARGEDGAPHQVKVTRGPAWLRGGAQHGIKSRLSDT